jgi:phage recombination protein Bet
MSNLARTNGANLAIGDEYGFEQSKVHLIKQLVARDANDTELALFLYTCQRTGLDPLARQIYCIHRSDRGQKKMTIQTGIDGYRLIADRTGKYAPGRANTFEYDEHGRVRSATAYVMKWAHGAWHEVGATAYMSEYRVDNNRMWDSKPHVMLGKCAEALALRRAFPAELSGIYTQEEMDQAGGEVVDVTPPPAIVERPGPQRIPQNPELINLKRELHAARQELARLSPQAFEQRPTNEQIAAMNPEQLRMELMTTRMVLRREQGPPDADDGQADWLEEEQAAA